MKVFPFKIPKPLNDNLVVQIDVEDQFYNKLHQHGEIQISYLVSGTGTLIVADSIHFYKPGELFIIGSNLPHVFQSDASEEMSHMITIFFAENSFGESFFDLGEFTELQPFFNKVKAGFKVAKVPSKIQEGFIGLDHNSKLNKFIYLLELIRYLSQTETKTLTSYIYPKNISDTDGKRMQLIFDYAYNNFRKDISLQTVSDLAYMTPNAFCRYFKQRTNKTFFQYLIELRIAYACKLLVDEKELPIEAISYRSGFKNLSNFNRKFKEAIKLTPNNYRAIT